MIHHARAGGVGLLWLLTILLWVLPATGNAQDRYRAARILFEEGNTLAANKDYKGALKKYKEARAIFPSPKIDVNIGTALRAMGYPAQAAEHFARFLRRVDPRTDLEMVRAVRATLDEVMKVVGSVTLRCDVEGAVVAVDGRTVGKTPLGRRIFLTPGTHRVSLTRPGHPEVVRTLALGKGDHQVVKVSWPPPPPPVAPEAASSAPQPGARSVPVYRQPISVYQEPAPAPTPPPSIQRSTPVHRRWWFWTAVVVVVAGATTGAILATQYGGSDRLPSGEAGSMVLR